MQLRPKGMRALSPPRGLTIEPMEKSPGRRLVWILAGVIPLLLFALLMLLLFTRQQERAVEQLLGEGAAGAAHAVDRAVSEQIGFITGLTTSRALDHGDLEAFRLDARRIWDMHPEWRTIILTNERQPILNLRFPPGETITPLRDPESLAQVWASKKASVGNLANGYVAFRVPVIRDHRMVYTIAVPTEPKFFRDAILRYPRAQSWAALIVGSDNVVIAATPDAPVQEGDRLPQTLVEKKTGGIFAMDALYAVSAPIGLSGWQVLTFAPASTVEQPFMRTRLAVYVGGILAVALTAVLVLVLSSAWATGREATRLRMEIAERNRAEEALRKSEERLRLAQDAAKAGTWEWDLRTNENFWSEELWKLFGLEPHSCEPTYDAWRQTIHPEDRPEAERAVKEAARNGTELSSEWRVWDRDGAERWLMSRGMPVRDAAGQAVRFIGIVIDVTERKRAEKALDRSRTEFEAIFNSISDAIIFTDTQGRILMVNPAFGKIFEYETEEVKGQTTEFLYADRECNEAQGRNRYHAGEAADRSPFEIFYKRKDGTLFPAESIGIPVRDSQGQVIGLIEIHRDITSRKQEEEEKRTLEAQLVQAQKMESVGRLAGGVAHDFNNMLNVILGYAEIAMSCLTPHDPLHDELQEIERAARRSADLTRQLLAFSRKQIVKPQVIDLNQMVEDQKKMLGRMIGEDIKIKFLPAADLWRIRIDPSQIDQILSNLAANARDAMPGVGTVTIETANVTLDESYIHRHVNVTPGDYVMFVFSDTGEGMQADTLDKIFEPFFTTKLEGRGTGLGLSTVYGIVKQNGGVINAYSEPGMGTTLKIYFPRFRGIAEEMAGPAEEVSLTGSETVLIVEDEEQILHLTGKILTLHGYQILTARTPAEACLLAEKHEGAIQLLLTDVVMPAMNGKELKSRIEQLRPGIRTLFMSGYTANAIAHRGVLEQGVDFIQKPFSVKSLAGKVREVLDAS